MALLPSQSNTFLLVSLLIIIASSSSSSSDSAPQNIETFFPPGHSASARDRVPPPSPPAELVPPPTTTTTSPPAPAPVRKSKKNSNVGKAVGVTAASTLVVSGVLFFLLHKFAIWPRRRIKKKVAAIDHDGGYEEGREVERPPAPETYRFEGTLKGVIVDENGLEVLYWRKLERSTTSTNGTTASEHGNYKYRFSKKLLVPDNRDRDSIIISSPKSKQVQDELPLLPVNHSSSTDRRFSLNISSSNPGAPISSTTPPPPPPVAPPPVPPPPPPPPPPKKNPAPQPPPPPVPPAVRSVGANKSSSRPPPVPSRTQSRSSGQYSSVKKDETTTKLKPLHWDKVTPHADHSMVWDNIAAGSFRFDDDLMEALFGYVATNRKTEKSAGAVSNAASGSCSDQVRILDPRKSQNIAIVLRSLAVTRAEILDAVATGRGLTVDTLEKLAQIAPTPEEQAAILEFSGDPSKLPDAESFLHFLLLRSGGGGGISSSAPFNRLHAMLFRATFDPEILHLGESLHTLDTACTELRNRGLFLKLLEAVLKAGNRMNAGTARGNAQAFDLSALLKLSDVKSSDGKTTLLHFVVEEVVRSEGKRCVLNRNHSFNSRSRSSVMMTEEEEDYMRLGLPVVGGLAVEFANVKKAATLDLQSFSATTSMLGARVKEHQRFIAGLNVDEDDQFVKTMKGFLEEAEGKLERVRNEEKRVLEIVKRTYEYYQAGASAEKGYHPLQLFVVVKNFLSMVDRVCVDIARNIQQQKKKLRTEGTGRPLSVRSPDQNRVIPRFANLPAHFMMSDKYSNANSRDSDDGF